MPENIANHNSTIDTKENNTMINTWTTRSVTVALAGLALAMGASRSQGEEVKEEAAKAPAAASAAAVPGAIAADNKPDTAPVHYGANLVENCDFESGDIVPEGWYIDAGADALKCEIAGGKAGPRCVRVAETKKFLLQQEIPVFSGGTYKVSAHVKTKDFSCKRGYLVIVPYGWPTQFGVILNDLKGTSDWKLLEETVKVDRKPEEKKYTVAFYIEEGKGELWLDGVRVEEVLQGITVRPGAIVCDFTAGAPRGLATVTVRNGSPEPRRIDIAGMQAVPQTVDLPPGAAAEVRVGVPLKPVWRKRTGLYVSDDAAVAGNFTVTSSGGEAVDVQPVTRAWSNLCIEPLQVVVQDPWQAKMPSGSTEYVKAKVKLALPPEQLRAGTLQSRLVSRETGKEALRHEVRGPAAAIPLELDVRELPWGAYDLHVNLSDAGGRAMVSTRRQATVLPGGKQQIRVLNNLVSELMDARGRGLLGQTRIEFMNPRDGWVWFRAAGACALKLGHDSLLSAETGKPAAEAMRLLRAGKHVLEVSGHPTGLTVRAIPALVYNVYLPRAPWGQSIAPFGVHTWARLSKHVLPNVNTIESLVVDTPEHREWLAQGKHWTPHVQAPGLIDKQAWTVDKMREVWLNPGKPTGWPERPSFTLDKFTGISVDEYAWSGPSAEIVKMTTASIADLADHPAYAGKLWIPWFASCRGANAEERRFLKTVLGNGWPFKEEVYLSEMPTEPENLTAIRSGFAKVASKYEAASPGSVRHMIFVAAHASLPTCSLNRCPQADFRVHLDMQMQALATDPAYFGLWGVEFWRSHYVDEEILNCTGMLLRHYGIEGKTGRMLSDPYELKHVANPDFTDGTQGWQVQAAEPGSVRTDAFAGYGTIQGRYPRRNGIGDTFAVLTRSAKAPNAVSQQLRGLTPGRLYSLKVFTGDYADLQAGKTRQDRHILSIALDGVEVLPGSFAHPFASHDYPEALAAYIGVAGKAPFWMTYHWLRFRATGPTATLTLSDWAKPGEPGGPAGQQTMVNFVEVQPVLEAAQ